MNITKNNTFFSFNFIAKATLFAFAFSMIFTAPFTVKAGTDYVDTGSYIDSGYSPSYGSYIDSGYTPSYGSYVDNGYTPSYGSYVDNSYSPSYGSYIDSGYTPSYGSYVDSGYTPSYGSYVDNSYSPSYGSYIDTPVYASQSYTSTPVYAASYGSSYQSVPVYRPAPVYNYSSYTPPSYPPYNPPVQTNNLSVSCNVSGSARIGDTVTWSASVSGGNGGYTYSWSGTDGLSGSTQTVTRSYNTTGSKSGTVTVQSGGRTASANCGNVFINDTVIGGGSLQASCFPQSTNVNVGNTVQWIANVTGGNGNYTYEWSGTNPLAGLTGSNPSVRYDSGGTKYGSVTVRSGGASINVSCGNLYVYGDYNNTYNPDRTLAVSCYANQTNVGVNQGMRWISQASGGNGYYTYEWSGTDSLYGSDAQVSRSYSNPGYKSALVTVRSGGQTRTVSCDNSVNVGGSVTLYRNGQAPLASLSSVSLSQVPYTGPADTLKFWLFIAGLLAASALGTWYVMKVMKRGERRNLIAMFKQQNLSKRVE